MHRGRTWPQPAGVLTHPSLSVVLNGADGTHDCLLARGALIQQHFVLDHLLCQLFIVAAGPDEALKSDTITACQSLEPVLTVRWLERSPDGEHDDEKHQGKNQDTHNDLPGTVMRKG